MFQSHNCTTGSTGYQLCNANEGSCYCELEVADVDARWLGLGDCQAKDIPLGLGHVHVIECYLDGLFLCISWCEASVSELKPEGQNIMAEGECTIWVSEVYIGITRFVRNQIEEVSPTRQAELKFRYAVQRKVNAFEDLSGKFVHWLSPNKLSSLRCTATLQLCCAGDSSITTYP